MIDAHTCSANRNCRIAKNVQGATTRGDVSDVLATTVRKRPQIRLRRVHCAGLHNSVPAPVMREGRGCGDPTSRRKRTSDSFGALSLTHAVATHAGPRLTLRHIVGQSVSDVDQAVRATGQNATEREDTLHV